MQELINSSFEYLKQCIKAYVVDYGLADACLVALDIMMEGEYPASQKFHQAYKGGLIVHIAEVMEAALAMAKSQFLEVDTESLVAAIIYHDFGKIDEYKVNEKDEIEYTSNKRLIGHLSKSYAYFMQDHLLNEFPEEKVDKIGHIILAHHGQLIWGSPIEPKLTEAYIIHFADMLSARVAKKEYVRNNNA